MSKHPVQPLETDSNGVLRFKSNKIVRFLLDAGTYDLNKLAIMDFSDNDWEQFAQLIGYSLSGFSELPYVSDETYEQAAAQQSVQPTGGILPDFLAYLTPEQLSALKVLLTPAANANH